MKNFFRVMAGRKSSYVELCHSQGFIGVDFGIDQDLTHDLSDAWRDFNKAFIPVFLANNPGKSKISAGLACGALWTVARGIRAGDTILTPDGAGSYLVGEVQGGYQWTPGQPLPHRRKVKWQLTRVQRSDMSDALRHSTGSIGTVCDVSDHRDELGRLVGSVEAPTVVATHADIEDPLEFAMEKHLEEFMVANWAQTPLVKDWKIFEEDGELIGQQYVTDAGIIDILARSSDNKRLLVVELKRGRASDVVVGQLLRYMGFVREEVAEEDQSVEGLIIALEDDVKLRWALSSVPSVRFMRYEVNFRLFES
jgi:restriction system protein